MNVKTRHFGKLPSGENVEEYSLTNNHGLTLKFIIYGGIINELHVPDRHGATADVVLGFSNLDDYLGPHPYFGCLVGRVAGRITGGKFKLNGRLYQLALNDPPNHLHGGIGFGKRLWRATTVDTPQGPVGVKLTYHSPQGEDGYPGNVDVSVTYSVTDENEVVIDYEAIADAVTPFSMTSHSYFNLAGEGSGTIENHLVQISSADITKTDAQMTLLGIRSPVTGNANDFNQPKRLGDAIPHLLNSHGDNYLLAHPTANSLERVARLEDPSSGRIMDVLTTERCLQLYTAAVLDGSLIGKSGRRYPKFGGLCLECQGYPDGANHPELCDIILRPGEMYRQTTIYRFYNK